MNLEFLIIVTITMLFEFSYQQQTYIDKVLETHVTTNQQPVESTSFPLNDNTFLVCNIMLDTTQTPQRRIFCQHIHSNSSLLQSFQLHDSLFPYEVYKMVGTVFPNHHIAICYNKVYNSIKDIGCTTIDSSFNLDSNITVYSNNFIISIISLGVLPSNELIIVWSPKDKLVFNIMTHTGTLLQGSYTHIYQTTANSYYQNVVVWNAQDFSIIYESLEPNVKTRAIKYNRSFNRLTEATVVQYSDSCRYPAAVKQFGENTAVIAFVCDEKKIAFTRIDESHNLIFPSSDRQVYTSDKILNGTTVGSLQSRGVRIQWMEQQDSTTYIIKSQHCFDSGNYGAFRVQIDGYDISQSFNTIGVLTNQRYFISWIANSSPKKYGKVRLYQNVWPIDGDDMLLIEEGNFAETCIFKHKLMYHTLNVLTKWSITSTLPQQTKMETYASSLPESGSITIPNQYLTATYDYTITTFSGGETFSKTISNIHCGIGTPFGQATLQIQKGNPSQFCSDLSLQVILASDETSYWSSRQSQKYIQFSVTSTVDTTDIDYGLKDSVLSETKNLPITQFKPQSLYTFKAQTLANSIATIKYKTSKLLSFELSIPTGLQSHQQIEIPIQNVEKCLNSEDLETEVLTLEGHGIDFNSYLQTNKFLIPACTLEPLKVYKFQLTKYYKNYKATSNITELVILEIQQEGFTLALEDPKENENQNIFIEASPTLINTCSTLKIPNEAIEYTWTCKNFTMPDLSSTKNCEFDPDLKFNNPSYGNGSLDLPSKYRYYSFQLELNLRMRIQNQVVYENKVITNSKLSLQKITSHGCEIHLKAEIYSLDIENQQKDKYQIKWELVSSTASKNTQEISRFLEKVPKSQFMFIPNQLLEGGKEYEFRVSFTNYFGVQVSESIKITVNSNFSNGVCGCINSTQYIYQDLTCEDGCSSQYSKVVDGIGGLKACTFICDDSTQFALFNNTCQSNCPSILKQELIKGYKYCSYPCKEENENIYLQANGQCKEDCLSPFTPIKYGGKQFCELIRSTGGSASNSGNGSDGQNNNGSGNGNGSNTDGNNDNSNNDNNHNNNENSNNNNNNNNNNNGNSNNDMGSDNTNSTNQNAQNNQNSTNNKQSKFYYSSKGKGITLVDTFVLSMIGCILGITAIYFFVYKIQQTRLIRAKILKSILSNKSTKIKTHPQQHQLDLGVKQNVNSHDQSSHDSPTKLQNISTSRLELIDQTSSKLQLQNLDFDREKSVRDDVISFEEQVEIVQPIQMPLENLKNITNTLKENQIQIPECNLEA